MKPNWNNVTVQQFQDIHRLSLSTDLDDMGKVERAIAILFNMTENEVDNLTIQEFNKYATQCSFLFTDEVPGKAVKYIKTGTKKYKIPYEPKKLSHGQYVDIVTFSEKPIENMHLIIGTLLRKAPRFPFNLFKKYDAVDDLNEISERILNARIIDVYHSCVFFCKLFAVSIEAMRGYLVAEMTRKGMRKEQAEMLLNDSINAMAGFTQQSKLQITTT